MGVDVSMTAFSLPPPPESHPPSGKTNAKLTNPKNKTRDEFGDIKPPPDDVGVDCRGGIKANRRALSTLPSCVVKNLPADNAGRFPRAEGIYN
jgi:hypothetical protein